MAYVVFGQGIRWERGRRAFWDGREFFRIASPELPASELYVLNVL